MKELTAVVTGAQGFIGGHVVEALGRQEDLHAIGIDVDSPAGALDDALAQADVVFHIAGVNRPEDPEEFETGNFALTLHVLNALSEKNRRPILVLASSAQAMLNNPYGSSKRKAEAAIADWAVAYGASAVVFRLPGVFGKWSRPNYNSVVATFCHNAAHGLPSTISDPSHEIELVYIDDVVSAFLGCIGLPPCGFERRSVAPMYRITLQTLADRIGSFADSRHTGIIPDFSDPLTLRLYATYLSHLDPRAFGYSFHVKSDGRGALAEMLKHPSFGQIFVSRTKPGITRGHHYHHTKAEKFMVVEGDALIRFQNIRGGPTTDYRVRGDEFRVIDIPPGYAHSIQNVGGGELVTLFWADEVFDSQRPDTYPWQVGEEEVKP